MNIEQFEENFKHIGQKTKIKIYCDICGKENMLSREKAEANIFKNGCYIDRSCSAKQNHLDHPRGEDVKEKQRLGRLGKKHSTESKQKISSVAKKNWATPEGEIRKKVYSKRIAKQHASGKLDKSKRKIFFISAKNNNQVRVCLSSAEFIACEDILEKDPNIASYEMQVYYEINNRSHSLDVLITYVDGNKKAVEIKPKKRLSEEKNILQMTDSEHYAKSQGWIFEIWSEEQLGISNWKLARDRADEYCKKNFEIDFASYRKENIQKKSKKHYDTKIAIDKVEVFCEYCQETHYPLRKTYEANIARNNGKYICEKHGGFISGSKPKLKLRKVNPYAAEGKKQCNGIDCKQVKPFEEFDLDSSKIDGRTTLCKTCRRKKQKERDDKKKLEK